MKLLCANCQTEVQKEQKEYNRSKTKRFFCNRSCASSFNNKHKPKRKRKIKTCLKCPTELPRGGRKFCEVHSPWYKDIPNLTLGDIRGGARHQKHAVIRHYARRIYFQNFPNPKCCNCEYSKHVEVAHIRPINSFPLSTSIRTINALSNLVGLCPNCHWEFDHDLLTLSSIPI